VPPLKHIYDDESWFYTFKNSNINENHVLLRDEHENILVQLIDMAISGNLID
jgi:hypothetical protein